MLRKFQKTRKHSISNDFTGRFNAKSIYNFVKLTLISALPILLRYNPDAILGNHGYVGVNKCVVVVGNTVVTDEFRGPGLHRVSVSFDASKYTPNRFSNSP